MPLELDEISIQQQFEEVITSENKLAIQEFLNDQNISDVAELIYENEDYECQIISHLLRVSFCFHIPLFCVVRVVSFL